MTIWALSPLLLIADPTAFGIFEPYARRRRLHPPGGADLARCRPSLVCSFRTVQLFFIRDVQTGLVWATKILTDPFHDIKLYWKAPLIWRGELIEPNGTARIRALTTRARKRANAVAVQAVMATLLSAAPKAVRDAFRAECAA